MLMMAKMVGLTVGGAAEEVAAVPTFFGYDAATNNEDATTSVPLPTSYPAGILLLWAIGFGGIATPSGWTQIAYQNTTDYRAALFWRSTVGAGSSVSVSITEPAGLFMSAAVANGTTVTGGTITRSTSTTTATGSSITAPAPGVLIGFYYSATNSNFTAPSGMTASARTTNGGHSIALAYQNGVGEGSTGNKNGTFASAFTTQGVLAHVS